MTNQFVKTNKQAFTTIELLVVIAIIGILFIALIFGINFATDKAKTSGVQTDFRSFQSALETVASEHDGFATFGWDLGDIKRADFEEALPGYTYTNEAKDAGDRVRNSYDVGDVNLNGVCDAGETFNGQKVYTETWIGVYSLVNPADASDTSGILALEQAINSYLDESMHIKINNDFSISMMSDTKDPWKVKYHGAYITNVMNDYSDRGAIIIYSNGPDQKFGSEHKIDKGVVTITTPNDNVQGQDDLNVFVACPYEKEKEETKIVVDSNIVGEFVIPENSEAEYDFNGNGVEGAVVNKGTVDMCKGFIKYVGIGFSNKGNAILTDINIEAGTPSQYAVQSYPNSTTTYNNVNITSAGGGIAATDNVVIVFNSGNVAVNSTSTSGRYVFYAVGTGSTIVINDGDFSFSKTMNQKRAYVYAEEGTTVFIRGGNFGKASTRSGYKKGIMGPGTVIITGGTFGFNPTEWVAEGYKAVKTNGVWTVMPE